MLIYLTLVKECFWTLPYLQWIENTCTAKDSLKTFYEENEFSFQERLEQLIAVETFGYVIFKDYMQTSFTGRFNIYDIILEKQYFQKPEDGTAIVSKEDSTLINVAFCRILGTLFCYGYDVVVSSDLARDSHSHTTVFFRLRDPHHDYLPLHCYSHKFICVSPYSTDSILLINIPKVAVEPILKVSWNQRLFLRLSEWNFLFEFFSI